MSRPKLHIQQNDLFCKNLCGFFGNPQWGGFCSKCYRELIQSGGGAAPSTNHTRKPSVSHDVRQSSLTTPTGDAASTVSVGAGFGGFEEKKKKTLKMSFFKKAKQKPAAEPDTPPGAPPSSGREAEPCPAGALGPPSGPAAPTATPTASSSARSLSASPVLWRACRSPAPPPRTAADPCLSDPDPTPRPCPAVPENSPFREVVFTCLQPPYCLYLKYAKSLDPGQSSPRPSHLSQESIQIHKVLTEFLAGLSKPAADDVRRQIQMNMENCISASASATSDEMSDFVQSFYNTFHDRIHSQSAYYGVSSERRSELEDLVERYLTTRLYRVLFTPLSQQLEEADLAVQKRIRSLYWVSAQLLELNIDESNPAVTELVELAITDIIEMDSKRTPQDKLACISSCVSHLLEMLCVGRQGEPPSADDLLPAIIFVVLRANPPRLQSNVQYVTRFSSQQRIMSGQQGYDFTNLCCAVSFIESMGADSLGLTVEEYERYMSGEVLPPAADWESGQYRCQALRTMEANKTTLGALQDRQNKLLAEQKALEEEMDTFSETVSSSVEETLTANPLTLRPPKRPAQLDSPSTNVDGLPAPLVPQVVDSAPSDASDGGQLPAPPPGLLTDAQDSLSSVLTLSQMTLEPARPPAGRPSEPPPPPPPSSSSSQAEAAGTQSGTPSPVQPESPGGASLLAASPGAAPLRPSLPSPPQQAPPQQAPPRPGRPQVRNIPSIPCSTGAAASAPMVVPPGRSAELPRSFGRSPDSVELRRMSELPRSLSHSSERGELRRLSELPRSLSHNPPSEEPRRVSQTRTEALAQEARRFSLARAELSRGRLPLDEEQLRSPVRGSDLRLPAREEDRRYSVRDEERRYPVRDGDEDRRYSVRDGDEDRRYSVRDGDEERRSSRAAAATAALAAECEAAKQRSKNNEKQDKLVKVLSGIFSLTDNF